MINKKPTDTQRHTNTRTFLSYVGYGLSSTISRLAQLKT